MMAWKNIHHTDGSKQQKQQKAGVAILLGDKLDFKTKL